MKKVKVFISFKATVSIDEHFAMDSIDTALKLTSTNKKVKVDEQIIWDLKPDKEK